MATCLVGLGLLLSACGGGGTDDGEPAPPGSPTLTVNVSGSGRVLSQPAGIDCGRDCLQAYAVGTDVRLTASSAVGQRFSGWGGACTGTSNACVVSMDASRTVTAAFNPIPPSSFTLTVGVSGNGRVVSQPAGIDCGVDCREDLASGTRVVLTALPFDGQVLTGWGGACAGAATSCSVTMDQARSVSVLFAAAPLVQRSLGVRVSGQGAVRSQPVGIDCGSQCDARFGDGTRVVLSVEPEAGQRFGGWSGACSGTSSSCTLDLRADRDVSASFVAASSPARWQTPLLMEASDDFNVDGNLLTAISPAGHAIVLWEQSDGTPDGSTRKIVSRRYLAGQGWQPTVVLPGLLTSGSGAVRVTGRLLIDDSGAATWMRPNLETRRLSAAGAWGAAFLPAARSGGTLSAAVMDTAGGIRVLIAGSDVWSNTLPAGANAWQDWVQVDRSGALAADDADLALSGDGSAMAIWRERNPGDSYFSIKAARLLSASGWQAPQTIDNSFDNVIADTPPRVAMDASGGAIAVWHQGDSVYYNVFGATSGWGQAVEVDANAVSSVFPAAVRVVMTAAGRAVAVWRSGLFAMKSMAYTPGQGFAAPVVVNPYALQGEIGMDGDGNATVVYVAPDRWPNPTTGLDVQSRALAWGRGWSDATHVEPTYSAGVSSATAFNAAGQGVAAWVRPDVAGASRQSLWVSVLR